MNGNEAVSAVGDRRGVAKTAMLWLMFLAPFFYLTYGTANWLASTRDHVPDLAFGWETHVPFIAWTIVPYWTINALYAASLFVNDTPRHVAALAGRYLTAQTVAVLCFIAFPLTVVFIRPETYGLPGFMFDVLGGFDKPFNQAPSLHIALTIIIWDHLRGRMKPVLRLLWALWCTLIGISVLTTWQHHFIDIPTGALLGMFALWLFPADAASPAAGFRLSREMRARRLAARYCGAAALLLVMTAALTPVSGAALSLLWPALALGLVSFGYAGAGVAIFQKRADGTVGLASRWLFAPYRLGARLNIVFWTRQLPARVEIADDVHLGRFPKSAELTAFGGVVDLSGEFARPPGDVEWRAFPAMDLLPPPRRTLGEAASAIEELRSRGPVLVCCALGFQRSAGAVAEWLVQTGRAPDMGAAVRFVAARGRPVHLAPEAVS